MELVVVSKTRGILEKTSSASFSYPNQRGTQEIGDEVLSSLGAQGIDTSGYQVSADLGDVEFYWEND